MNTADEKVKYLDGLAAQIHEHFDHVQILVSWNEGGNTHDIFTGAGSWYARQGMAHEFINRDKSVIAADKIGDVFPKDRPDDGDEWKEAGK